MSEVFLIADTHFGHRRFIQFSETAPHRPFATIEEHDEELMRRRFATVGPKDTVRHPDDFCFGERNLEIAARLDGNKKLAMGNHDMYATEDYLRYFTRLVGIIECKGLVLSHSPLHESLLARWCMNVRGHLHTHRYMRPPELQRDGNVIDGKPDPRYVCVPAEQVDLTPVPFDWILNKWAEAN